MVTFRTTVPQTQNEAAESLARITAVGHNPLVVGGGTLVVPALVRGDIVTAEVVDLGRTGLDRITYEPGTVRLGALVSYQQVLDCSYIRQHIPLLHTLCAGITGGIQIRNQGTIVGALCAARPQSDIPAALVALDAEVFIHSTAGTRYTSARGFLHGAEHTDLTPEELVTEIRIPLQTNGSGYVKIKGSESSWPVVTAAAVVPGHVVLGGVADVPQRVRFSASTGSPEVDTVREAVAEHLRNLPDRQRWSDLRADWNYRRRVAPEAAVRAVAAARQGLGHE